MKISKTELIKEIEAEHKGESVTNVVNAFISKITEHLRNDDTVTIKGFGTFKTILTAERHGVSPAGLEYDIPSQKRAKAHMSKEILN